MKLEALRIPAPLRGFAAGDAQLFDVTLAGDKVASITPSAQQQHANGTLLSAPVEAHAHIDKNYTVQDVGAAEGNLFVAIERMNRHRESWTGESLRLRMERALRDAWRSGTRALRTHLDWVQPEPPAALAVFESLREEWRGRVELQFVSLTPLDLFADIAAGERIAREVKRAGGVLGAFVYRNEGVVHKLGRVFDLAQQHGLALDFHVDEGLDVEATGLRSIAQLVRARDFRRGVVCGHACSLSVQDDAVATETLALCAGADIHLVALPTTNLYLQGAWDRTPLQRGITRIREAAARGLRASLATDNVQDAFYPYGSYDLLETFGLGVQMAHLAPASDWLDTVTVNPAKALGLAWDGRIAPGCPADLLVLSATDEHELIGPRGRQRTVIRAGQRLESNEQ
ncbi:MULTISPECIES: amidohydrolase family protein [unclassified Variovorax]|jgi:cytosine deaminase|uniref:amidohydrolase family protein n=1 Tax=unclassified Variovorax TaxID=663243 RepID=UPI000F7E4FB0|nr:MULTISPECIES: amidohydrolase family protein [unclassified Variovorax]RSZ38401.1 amidohydrolase [Variovorax sp. 553]RSZ39147.1 amidohydrolase [Variovorax sp. 679]